MKHFALLILIFFSCKISIYGQEIKQKKFNVNASTGYVSFISNDALLNYYIYSGKSFLPIQLQGCYSENKNITFLKIYFNTSRLYPRNIHNAYYEYNYIRNWNSEFNLEFYRKLTHFKKNISFFLGLANNAYLFIQEEFYNNLLYEYSPGYRKSFDYSPLNISLNFLCDFKFHKSSLQIKSGFSLLNLAVRPDDNSVKQFGLSNHSIWKLFTPKDYRSIHASIFYTYNFNSNFGLTAEYNIWLYSFQSSSAHKYLRNLCLVGLSKSF